MISKRPGSASSRTSTIGADLDPAAEIIGIAGLPQRRRPLDHLVGGEIAQTISDLLRAGDLDSLAMLDGAHERGGFVKAVVGAGIEPGIAAAEANDVELAGLEIAAV